MQLTFFAVIVIAMPAVMFWCCWEAERQVKAFDEQIKREDREWAKQYAEQMAHNHVYGEAEWLVQ